MDPQSWPYFHLSFPYFKNFIVKEKAALTVEVLATGLDSSPAGTFYTEEWTDAYSVKEVVDAVKKITQKEFKVSLQDRRVGDPAKLVGGRQSALRILGWKPIYRDIETIVEHAWEWHKKL